MRPETAPGSAIARPRPPATGRRRVARGRPAPAASGAASRPLCPPPSGAAGLSRRAMSQRLGYYARFENVPLDVMGPTVGPFSDCLQLSYGELRGVLHKGDDRIVAYHYVA